MPKRVAVIAAMDREVRPFVRGWQRVRVDGLRGWRQDELLVVCGGIGPGPAERAAEMVVKAFAPQVLVSAGFAGSLDTRWKVPGIIVPERVIDARSGREYRTVDSAGESTLLTMDSIADAVSKQELAKLYRAQAVDMEAAAVAQVAHEHGLEFRAIKAVSEDVEFPMPSFGPFLDEQGKFRTLLFVACLMMRPKWWGSVRSLRRNTTLAASALAHALRPLNAEVAALGDLAREQKG